MKRVLISSVGKLFSEKGWNVLEEGSEVEGLMEMDWGGEGNSFLDL